MWDGALIVIFFYAVCGEDPQVHKGIRWGEFVICAYFLYEACARLCAFPVVVQVSSSRLQTRSNINSQSIAESLNRDKHLLQRAAVLCSVCLIVNLVCTVLTSAKMKDWSADSDTWLDCQLFETWNQKNIEAYDLSDLQSVCAPADVTFSLSKIGCKADCEFHERLEGAEDPACFGKTKNAFLCAISERALRIGL